MIGDGTEAAWARLRARALGAVHPEAAESARRGWIYRMLGPGPEARVLAFGDVDLAAWFEHVVVAGECSGPDMPASRYDLVVLHATLGGCQSVDQAIDFAARQLTPRGMVALTGANAWRRGRRTTPSGSEIPLATPAAYRRAMRDAGLRDVTTYFVRPDPAGPTWLVDTGQLSASPFLAADAAAARAAGRTFAAAMLGTARSMGAAVLLERWLLTTGRRC